jgi:hypothetical protein
VNRYFDQKRDVPQYDCLVAQYTPPRVSKHRPPVGTLRAMFYFDSSGLREIRFRNDARPGDLRTAEEMEGSDFHDAVADFQQRFANELKSKPSTVDLGEQIQNQIDAYRATTRPTTKGFAAEP